MDGSSLQKYWTTIHELKDINKANELRKKPIVNELNFG